MPDPEAGKLIDWAQQPGGWLWDIVKRSDDVAGFELLPKCSIVERTFAGMSRYGRRSKDYEMLTQSWLVDLPVRRVDFSLQLLAVRWIPVIVSAFPGFITPAVRRNKTPDLPSPLN